MITALVASLWFVPMAFNVGTGSVIKPPIRHDRDHSRGVRTQLKISIR